jgi:lysophospholipid acyltransferase (LPLAT)-like uncharacterized protein
VGTAIAGFLAGIVARVWLATLRVRVEVHPGLAQVEHRPWVLAFWHGTQWPLLACRFRAVGPSALRRRRPTVVMVSWSRDGALQARALRVQGLEVVRGSSSRGAVRGLAALVRVMKRRGADAAFAVDGPRGPYGMVKGGAVAAARAAGAVLVPVGGVVRRGVVLRRAWDRFAIAWPFSRVDVTFGAPVEPVDPEGARVEVERALWQLNAGTAGQASSEAA